MVHSRGAVSLMALLVAVLIVYADLASPSPGPISAVHAQAPELSGSSGCVLCHGDEERGMTRSCLQCHEDIASQLSAHEGLHAQLTGSLVNECERCHTEHHGRDFQIAGHRSFTVAGYEDRDAYAHEGLGFSLEGRHLEMGCSDCHQLADVGLLEPGSKRFTDLQQDCTSCHEDPHGGEQPNCAGCHGQEERFEVVPFFQHDPVFPLVGAHSGLACGDCHQEGTERSVEEALRGTVSRRDVRGCADCHQSPHLESFLSSVADSLGLTRQQRCARCHSIEDDAFHAPLAELDRELHACTGFPLLPPHRDLSCQQCHEGYGKDDRSFQGLYPGRHPDDCMVCHGDPHGGEFEAGPFKGESCTTCHERLTFHPSRFTIAQHDRTRFPLTGGHRAVGCNDCHRKVSSSAELRSVPRQFRGTPRACEKCHADVHQGAFDRPGLPAQIDGRSGCARCHVTDSFSTLSTSQFDHGLFTEFPLHGAHASARCNDCHTEDRADRTPGRAVRTCAQCHEDPHAGQFRKGVGTDCARCHRDDRTFLDLRFDHDRDSRFSLGDSHEHLACAACHKPYPLPDGGTVVRYRPLGTLCTACHGDMGGDRSRSTGKGGR